MTHYTDVPNFPCVRNMRSAICLQIQSDDFDYADLRYVRREQIDFGPDQVSNLERFLAVEFWCGPRVRPLLPR